MTKNEINKSVGKKIKHKREELGITRDELAQMIGVSGFGAISNYENGISVPKTEIMVKLFEALNIDANYLFSECTPDKTEKITDEELDMIMRIRELDDYGKKTVNMIINSEYNRCQSQKQV